MATSFNVNKHDLEYILKQIKIAEVHASGTPLLQAIQAAYGVTANDAALLPAGLRTVDGSFNNLLPGRSQIGAADTLFPRLTDPVYLNDTDGDQMPLGPSGSGAPTITNNNYGTPGSVADADPRIISNLIVDMTAGNPAAVAAALAYVGITGAAANTARSIITAAHKNIATTAAAAVAAQSAEMAALALKNTETGEQAAAVGANINAQATLGAYNAALALDVEVKMAAVQDAVDAWVTLLGGIGSVINVADQAAAINAINIATTASQAAADAAALLLADLGAAHPDVIAAQAVADDAAALLTQLTALQLALSSASPDLDTSEFNAAATANTLAGTNAIDANANTAQLTASQTDASTAATTTALALTAANSAVTQDTTDLTNATAASNAADAAIIAAQDARIPIAAVQVVATTAYNTAVTNNQPTGLTLSAYNTAVAENLDTVTDTAKNAVADLVTSLGVAGDLIDGNDVLLADAAVGAALTASNAAAAAVAALSDPNVVPDDLADAQVVAADALALWTALTALRNNLDADVTTGDQLLDAADFTAAGGANILATNNAAAGLALDGQLGASQAAAVIANQPTADALAIAAADLSAANIALSFADDAITGAITFANAQQLAEVAAIADLAASELIQTAALAADLVAQATLAAYTAALAEDAEVKAAAAQTEAGELVTSLGAIGATVDAADNLAATEAVAAADAASTAATNTANLLLANLGASHVDVIAAQAVANNAALLLTQLTSLQSALLSSSPLLDASEFAAAAAALASASAAEIAANNADSGQDASQATAATTAASTAAALATANTELLAATAAHTLAESASNAADAAAAAAPTTFDTVLSGYGIEHDPLGSLVIPNLSPDIGLSPGFNSWMTFFGQFFDHGLDLVTKGNNGTVYVPLQADDPLIAGADGVMGTTDDLPAHLRFMALTRATPTIVDGVPQHENTTTSWIDQNQTYTSHPSHQVFLREYAKVDVDGSGPGGIRTVATGHLIDGTTASGSLDRAIGNWAEVKAQAKEMLGLILNDFDVHNVPLLATDQYGKFIPGANGYAQVVMPPDGSHTTNWLLEGTAAGLVIPNTAIRTGHAFLNDIAHHAAPSLVDLDHDPATPKTKQVADADIDANHNGVYDAGDTLTDVNGDNFITTADFFAADKNLNGSLNEATYDDEMLNSHFVTGDGRGNENIALTSVHSIFHSEHNRLVEVNKSTILASGDKAFINEWLLLDLGANDPIPSDASTLTWDGERLFQTARFATEMQYQHLVFEEFARRIQPNVDPFVFNNSPDINPSIVAEFAHTVYRFGHSMLTGTVDRLDNDLTTVNGEASQQTLLAAFLNPQMYVNSGTTVEEANANLIRGLSRDLGNEIDEFIVQDVRSNLLGLPLDLAALNIARGRETGIPSLNETRAQLYNAGALDLTPYTSWNNFAQNIKNPLSIVNFIAAYGTHASITSATTAAEMRDAATKLVFGDGDLVAGVTIRGVTYTNAERLAFLNGTDAYTGSGATGAAGTHGGLNKIDLWIGGLAEQKNEFGGMLGQTFNYVFEYQMERLQFGDRMYYLTRTQGLNILNNMEPNTFSDLVMRNTALGDKYSTHLNGALFVTPDHILELDRSIAQAGLDPEWEDPLQTVLLGDKVQRDYTGSTIADGTHDVGGYIKVQGGDHYVLGGTEGNDTLLSDKGIDTIWGDGGNDYINAGMESDDVFGGEGDDIIEDPFGDDVLRGNQGNDVITEARGADLVFGDEGSDYLVLGQDAAEAFGGEGNDFILGGDGKDFLLGNEGDDWIEGGAGFDTIAGENSELFFNSTIIGHDVLFNQGDEGDYDAESGDDIMGSGPSVFRYEGMFGFDWGIAKNDIAAVNFDLAIPIFTTIPTDVLRDRFDQTEALSGWKFDDHLDGDDRGHKGGGSSAPDSVPTELFAEHILTAEGIARITGLSEWLNGARQTLFGSVPGANATTYRDGNILMGGDGNDFLRGRGGYDLLDGDAWLNVRIKIDIGGTIYSAESMSSNTAVAGVYAGKVFNTDAGGNPIFTSPAFGGRSLTSLMLDRTINPGQMSIVREIKYDDTPGNNIDTAFFQGTIAEYDIEGRGALVTSDFNHNGTIEANETNVVQRAYDLNGDGFISVRDRDTGAVGATVNGVTLSSRGNLTDDLDLLKNIEQLQFADATIAIAGPNNQSTGTVTIFDPTPFDHDNNPGTPGEVSPYVGQLLPVSSVLYDLDNDANADGDLNDVGDTPIGPVSYEWQTTEVGNNAGWSTITTNANPYTVRPVDPGHVLRAVATFIDKNGITERVYSAPTGNPTVALNVNENSPTNTIVLASIPFSVDYDSLTGVDVDVTTLHHQINPAYTAGGRFTVVQNGFDANGNPLYQVLVANGGPANLDYETQDVFQIVDNQYQIVIDSYSATPANGGLLLASRQFTIFLNDVVNEGTPTDIIWTGVTPANDALPGTGVVIATLSTVDPDVGATFNYELRAGSSPGFAVDQNTGAVTATVAMAPNSTYVLNVRSKDNTNATIDETFTIRTGDNGVPNVVGGLATDDITYGLTGADNLSGGAGNDNLFGQADVDTLDGGIGNDILVGGTGNDTIIGGIGNDTIRYTVGDGNDTIDGGTETDTIVIAGTAADDSLTVNFNGTQIGLGSGTTTNVEIVNADLLAGTNTLSYAGSSAGVNVDLTASSASGFNLIANVSNVTGTGQTDTLKGNSSANVLVGGNGNDLLIATIDDVRDTMNGGNNTDTADYSVYSTNLSVNLSGAAPVVVTGSGTTALTSDVVQNIENVTGGSGFDTITGTNVGNVLSGGSGNDIINGVGGNDTINGGIGNDTINYAIGGGSDTVDGGADNDILNITGNANNDVLDVILSAGGVVTSVEGGSVTGIETINVDLGGNADTISYAGSAIGVTVNLGSASGAPGIASLLSVANATGTAQVDTLTGTTGNNVLTGGGGADNINGGVGTGDVAVFTGTAAQHSVTFNGTNLVVTDTRAGSPDGADTLSGIEILRFGANNFNLLAGTNVGNTLNSTAADEIILGFDGADIINYVFGNGNDAIDGGLGADTLNITGTAANEVLDVTFNGTSITAFENSTVTGVETVNVNLLGSADTISYGNSSVGVTVNLATNSGSGLAALTNVLNVTGTNLVDTLTGDTGANTLNGGAGIDTLNGGAGGDTLIGGTGADVINTGAADDNITDIIRFGAANEFGDTVSNFDASGTAAQVDRVEFTGGLNTAWDDGLSDDNFLFASGNSAAGTVNAVVGQNNADTEALLLTGVGGEGVINANLGNAALVSAAFNAEFNITAGNGEDALLVVNDTDGNSFGLYQWVQAGGGETAAGELTLIGIFNGNATVTTTSFDFV